MIGFMVCSKDKNANVKKPLREVSDEKELELYKYYSKRVHEAAFSCQPGSLRNSTRSEPGRYMYMCIERAM